MQIGMVYLQTGNSGGQVGRTATMRKLITEMRKGGKSLNIVTGDFNYVVDKMDRVSGETPELTGAVDAREAEAMKGLMGRVGLQELEQG
eukprot:8741344-Heterocapsa_arctica.AAC.1